MNNLKTQLVYNFYVSDDTYDFITNKIHLSCLKRYINVFDILHFVIMKDDKCSQETLKKVKNIIYELFVCQSLTIDIVSNDIFRESKTFYEQVVLKLSNNYLTFFGHNKGITNLTDNKEKNEGIFRWIVGCYFFSLNNFNEVLKALQCSKAISYGSYLTRNKEPHIKYKWIYNGTFMWINEGKLKNYIESNNIDIPLLTDRFYDEEFLGNIYDTWPLPYAMSDGESFLYNAHDFYENASYYTDILLDICENKDSFYNVYNEIINDVNYE